MTTTDSIAVAALVVSILSLVVSACTAAYEFYTARPKLSIRISSYWTTRSDQTKGYILNAVIENMSRMPITISSMSINIDDKWVLFETEPYPIAPILPNKKSASFPIRISAVDAVSESLLVRVYCGDAQLDLAKPLKLRVHTTRRVIDISKLEPPSLYRQHS